MDSHILQKYSDRLEAEAFVPDEPDVEAVEDFGCFRWLRGVRERAAMLVLKKKSGSCLAISYSWIERIEFDPSDGILIVAGPTTVRIQGRNLNAEVCPNVRLFEGLTRHSVPWISEASRAETMQIQDDECMVFTIEW